MARSSAVLISVTATALWNAACKQIFDFRLDSVSACLPLAVAAEVTGLRTRAFKARRQRLIGGAS